MDKVLRSLMQPINTSVILILGVFTIFWGLWLISPFWTVFTQAPLYAQMCQLAPESVWGWFAVAAGTFTVRGAIKPSYMNLRAGSWSATVMWSLITTMFFIGDWTSTGGITTLCFATYSFFVWLNIKINKPLYESKQT